MNTEKRLRTTRPSHAWICASVVCLLVAITPRSLAITEDPKKFSDVRTAVVSSPRPEYPYKSRVQHHVGAGIFILTVTPDGTVSHVTVAKSIGYAELDESGVKAFRQWRFKPGVANHVQIPLRFSMRPLLPRRTSGSAYDVVYYPKGISTSKPPPSPAPAPRR